MYNSFLLLDEVCEDEELLEELEELDEELLDEELWDEEETAEEDELLLEEFFEEELLEVEEVPLSVFEGFSFPLSLWEELLTVEEVLSLTVSPEVVPLTVVPLCSLPCTVELVPLVEAGAEEEPSSFFSAALHPQRSTAKIKNKTKYFFIIKTSLLFLTILS